MRAVPVETSRLTQLYSGLGYDRTDPSTIKEECLPIISAKGSEYLPLVESGP